jgi:hypothetical protein
MTNTNFEGRKNKKKRKKKQHHLQQTISPPTIHVVLIGKRQH